MSDFAIQPAGHSPIHSIRHVASTTSPHAANGSRRTDAFDPSAAHSHGGDRVELSDTARLLARMRDMPDVRQDRIDQVRTAIDRGTYDSSERVELAIEQLLQQEDLFG